MINSTRLQRTGRVLIAAIAIGGLGVAAVAATTADAAGIRNCVEVTGPSLGRVGCYENVWADGAEYRMTFSNQGFDGATPTALDRFYVVAPQAATPQGAMDAFPHDHVVRDAPAGNGGAYSAKLAGFFVLCSGQGLVSGACVPLWTSPGGPALPFAATLAGEPLTSTDAIEAAADAGNLVLVDLGPSAVIVGTINPGR